MIDFTPSGTRGLCPKFFLQRWAELRKRTSDQKAVATARLRSAGSDSAWKGQNAIVDFIHCTYSSLSRIDGMHLHWSTEPKVAAHDAIGKPNPPRHVELTAHRWDHPALCAVTFVAKLMTIAKQRHFASKFEVGFRIESIKQRAVGQVSTFLLIRASSTLSRCGSRSFRNRGTCTWTTAPMRPSGVSCPGLLPSRIHETPASESHKIVLLA